MDRPAGLGFGTQIRRSLDFDATVRRGAQGFSVCNHVYVPRDFGDPAQAGHTSTIRRVEGAMLSYRADADSDTNPDELGLDRLVDLDMDADCIGKAALRRIRDAGVSRRQVGLVIGGPRLPGPDSTFWPVTRGDATVGTVRSAVHSARRERNIALAMVSADLAAIVTGLGVVTDSGAAGATVVERSVSDPEKTSATE